MKKSKTIELSALRIFAAVAESETLTHAAQRLNITQSAVSQAVKQLEDQLQVDLVVRRSRPIRVTQSGQVLKEYAVKMMADNSRLMHDIKIASKGNLPHLRIGMIDSFSDSLGLQFITKIKPLVSKVSLQTGLTLPLTQALHDRDLDLLITSDPIERNPAMIQHALIRDPFLVIAPEKSLRDSSPSINDLAQQIPFIHYNAKSRVGAQTDIIARRIGVELNTQYEMDSTQTLVRFVRANHGWAIISALCLVRYANLLDGIRVISLNDGANARIISQLCRKDEIGNLPEKFAQTSRAIFDNEVSPKLKMIAPWLPKQAYSIDTLNVM